MNKIDEMKNEIARLAAAPVAEKVERLNMRVEELEVRGSQPPAEYQTKAIPGPGDSMTSEDFESLKRTGRLKFQVKHLWPTTDQKTTITSATVGSSTPGILVPSRVPGIVPAARRRLTIRDILPVMRTSNNTVEFVKEDTFTSAASPQTEGSAKAESALTFTIDSEVVRTLAHWIPATAQVLDDMDGLRRFLNQTLLYGLKVDEEDELLNGSGAGVHLSGLCTEAGAYAGTYVAASDNEADTLRHAVLELQAAEEEPDFMVINPVEWHNIELTKTDDGGSNLGAYIMADPLGEGSIRVPMLWGLQVIVSNTMAAGNFLVGSSAQAAIWDRMDATVDISTEHSDYFTKNLVAIRVEERLTLTTYRGGAFLYGSF